MLFLQEIADAIDEVYGVSPSITILSRLLKEWGMKSKVVQKRAQERNQDLRDAWRVKLLQWRASQLVFLDESAINEYTLQRCKGWTPIGRTASVVWPFKHTERWSILSAYTKDKFITHDVTQGSFTGDMFNAFVKDNLLPLCTPFPGPRSVIILDNCKIHYNDVCKYPYPSFYCH